MKQKYRIWKNEKEKELRIQEYAVLTAAHRKQKLLGLGDEDFSLLCEQTYQADEVKKAASMGKDELILLLRSQHFFPIGLYMGLIADAVTTMYAAKGEQYEDLIIDDKEILMGAMLEAEKAAITEVEKDTNDDGSVDKIDNLLEDDSQKSKKTVAGKIKQKQVDAK